MTTIESIDYINMTNSVEVVHFGWSKDEVMNQTKLYQSKFFGRVDDARFQITDAEGTAYYAIFRTAAEDEWIIKKTKDYLLFKDQNRVLLDIGGKLYRYLINERTVLDNSCYDGIIYNDFGKANSRYFHSLASPIHEILIIVDRLGIAAITWDTILWRHEFEWADCGHLELIAINNQCVIAQYEDCFDGKLFSISFDITNGKHDIKPR